MAIVYNIIAYKESNELDDIQYVNLEGMLNFIKEYEDESDEYKITTLVNGVETSVDTIIH